jgi:hypothetical protein
MIQDVQARTIQGVDELCDANGEELGVAPWHEVIQDWLAAIRSYRHRVAPRRAFASEIGSTLADEFFHAVAGPDAHGRHRRVPGPRGDPELRLARPGFQAPVAVGLRVWAHFQVFALTGPARAVRAILLGAFERHGTAKPGCVATCIRHLGTR